MFFLFLHENICCGNSLEAPRWGASNEFPQHMFSCRNKKNVYLIPPLVWSYDMRIWRYHFSCYCSCLNKLPHTIYWKSPISILGMSGNVIPIRLEKNSLSICKQRRSRSDATFSVCTIWKPVWGSQDQNGLINFERQISLYFFQSLYLKSFNSSYIFIPLFMAFIYRFFFIYQRE